MLSLRESANITRRLLSSCSVINGSQKSAEKLALLHNRSQYSSSSCYSRICSSSRSSCSSCSSSSSCCCPPSSPVGFSHRRSLSSSPTSLSIAAQSSLSTTSTGSRSRTTTTTITTNTPLSNSTDFFRIDFTPLKFSNSPILSKSPAHPHNSSGFRTFCTMTEPKVKAVLFGVFDNPDDKEAIILSPLASKFDAKIQGALTKQIKLLGPIRKGKVRVLYGLSDDYPVVSVVGLGPNNAGINELEEYDERKENIRTSVSIGVRHLRELGNITDVEVDPCTDARSASEGALLGSYYYDVLKSQKHKKSPLNVNMFAGEKSEMEEWRIGSALAAGQNLCRHLEESPANLMTPTIFAGIAKEKLTPLGVNVIVHDKAWAESQKMGSFLSVAKGSDEPPVFLEMHYNNAPNTKPVVFVGKGITFDSGGISLKPSSNMDKMRADMGGAANVLSTIHTLASLKAPVNIIGLTPLCENLPSGRANKPGDVVTAMNGKTIQVDNTDAEGRLILADGLCYAHQFDPLLILDIATLTGSMNVAMGSAATGVFTTTKKYWEVIHESGIATGDRMWRMPLWNHFTKQTTNSQLADLQNIGKVPGAGGCCIAAAFLKEFVTHPVWLHLDIAGVMDNRDEVGYLNKGMSGRPMRTLVKFVEEIYSRKLF